jgi:hypothetical protein
MGWRNKQNGDDTQTRSRTHPTHSYALEVKVADQTVDGRGFLYSQNFDRPCISLASQSLVVALLVIKPLVRLATLSQSA